mmetsp:Transcript_708/g.2457  ORF Transcript_708/g.2457 Transcript_708/m.2457 type:complete len:366 (-) Transcript_708:161-1258(-)
MAMSVVLCPRWLPGPPRARPERSPHEHRHRVVGLAIMIFRRLQHLLPVRRRDAAPIPDLRRRRHPSHPELLGVDAAAHEHALHPRFVGPRDVVLERVPDRDRLLRGVLQPRHLQHAVVYDAIGLAHQTNGAVVGHLGVPPGEGAGHREQTSVAPHGDDVGVGDDEGQVSRGGALQNLAHVLEGGVYAPRRALLVVGPRAVDGLGAVREEEIRLVRIGHRLQIQAVERDGAACGPGEVHALLTERRPELVVGIALLAVAGGSLAARREHLVRHLAARHDPGEPRGVEAHGRELLERVRGSPGRVGYHVQLGAGLVQPARGVHGARVGGDPVVQHAELVEEPHALCLGQAPDARDHFELVGAGGHRD